ncbi:MAG TPA: hypothetical protein VFI31_30100 [Pirellulales bacterium]|nr:hypothetical protein [Pirellulales bacterium]
MKKRILSNSVLFLLAALPLGCNETGTTTGTTRTTERTTTTTTRETAPSVTGSAPATRSNTDVDVNAGPNGATATGRTAASGRDAVDVDSTPGGGVDVKVQGEPILDRIRERRAARDAAVPR